MFKPLEVFIGLRYVRAKRRNHFISFISIISMLGVALGIWALITVLSVMNGFEKELRERILGMASHVTIEAYHQPMRDWQQVAEIASQHASVIGSAPYVQGQALLNRGKFSQGVIIRGVVPSEEPNVSEISKKMISGSLDALKEGEYGIILGRELALNLLGTTQIELLNDLKSRKISVIIPEANVTPIGVMPRFKRFTVVGIFDVGMHDYDSGLAVMHIRDAAKLYRLKGGISGVRLKLDDLFQAPFLARELTQAFYGEYRTQDWTRKHSNLFKAINMEKRVMFIILFLIVAVAAFNIVSTLVMMVTDKEADIAILRTLGASPGSIMGIFMVQGSVIGVIGTLLGLGAGIPTALNVETLVSSLERLLGIQFLSPDIYYISVLKSDVHWNDVTMICGFSLLLTLLATLYPAWRASRTQPAEALRYE
jgi:lipoprotein-releasing system permease protein